MLKDQLDHIELEISLHLPPFFLDDNDAKLEKLKLDA